jgi:hypothetical protein
VTTVGPRMRTCGGKLWKMGGKGVILGGCISMLTGLGRWDTIGNKVLGEEKCWQSQHKDVEPVVLPPGHFAQRRTSPEDHVWPASDRHIAYYSGGAVDLGEWDPAIVDRRKPEPKGVPVQLSKRDQWLDNREILRRHTLGIPVSEQGEFDVNAFLRRMRTVNPSS